MRNFGSDKLSALDAKFEAQKISFGPISFQAVRALRELGILAMVEESRKEGILADAIVLKLKLSRYGVQVLLDAGISIGVVLQKDDKFFLTKTGYFILNDPLTRANMDFVQDVNYLGFYNLDESVKNGKPEGLKVFGDWKTVYESLSSLPPKVQESWFQFDHYYSDLVFPLVMPLIFADKPKHLLDIGGNTGKFSLKAAQYNKEVKITILDLPGQLEVAYKNIAAEGLSHRIDGHAINLLEPELAYPSGVDAIWMSQFLDCFSEEEITHLLSRAYTALEKGGIGNSRMYHSEDMIRLVKNAGFEIAEDIDGLGVSHTLLKCKK
ncbi:MAG: SAM-dependent methyltransferase [Bacteroidetes bacterium 4572_77]|nr:MAG: SAM-dependent methyltransferase [Bacteroidetes bacterium 4572_77]